MTRSLSFAKLFSVLLFTVAACAPMAAHAQLRPVQIPLELESNEEVDRWIHFFAIEDHARFDRFMQRGSKVKSLLQEILRENGVPAELYYLAMIESGFSRRARSEASAVGVWQFGAATARLNGLRIDREVDERFDMIRATSAAARHLRQLKSEFGSWYMAMAAYNCGVGCARKAIRRGHSRDYWTLARRGVLPIETANYVPKFQAAMAIANDPEHYGFHAHSIYEFPKIHRVRVPGRQRIAEIARHQKVSIATILAYNPQLFKGKTPSARNGYQIWLPRDSEIY